MLPYNTQDVAVLVLCKAAKDSLNFCMRFSIPNVLLALE